MCLSDSRIPTLFSRLSPCTRIEGQSPFCADSDSNFRNWDNENISGPRPGENSSRSGESEANLPTQPRAQTAAKASPKLNLLAAA